MPLEKYALRWQPDNDHPWAGKKFHDAIREEVKDELAVEYIEAAVASDLATESYTCNGLNGVKNVLLDNDDYMQLYHVCGGIERVVDGLRELIEADVRMNTRVCCVKKEGEQFCVYTCCDGQESELKFDAVFVCLPNHWLGQVKWEGDLRKRIHSVASHYDLPAHYLRVSMLFDCPFWQKHGMPGDFFMMDTMNGCCAYDESYRWGFSKLNEAKSGDIDEKLWEQLCSMMPQEAPQLLPKLLGVLDTGTKVMLVDGDWVKLNKSMDYVEGANCEANSNYVPHCEVWIDSRIQPKDWAFIAYHEEYERQLMSQGYEYDDAHKFALEKEKTLRRRGDVSYGKSHILSFLLCGQDALLMCSGDWDEEDIADYLIDCLPDSFHDEACEHLVCARVSRYVGSINAQPGGWPVEDLMEEHIVTDGVYLVGDYFFDSTLNGALISSNTATDLYLKHLGLERSDQLPDFIQALGRADDL
jgi:hypothetical protein